MKPRKPNQVFFESEDGTVFFEFESLIERNDAAIEDHRPMKLVVNNKNKRVK